MSSYTTAEARRSDRTTIHPGCIEESCGYHSYNEMRRKAFPFATDCYVSSGERAWRLRAGRLPVRSAAGDRAEHNRRHHGHRY